MSQANVDAVDHVFDYGNEVMDLLLRGSDPGHPWFLLWHPECVLEELAEVPDAATYHGREGIARYFQQLGDLWDDARYTPVEIVEGTDGVFAAIDMWNRSKSGVETEMRVFQVFRLQDGMVVYVTGYVDRKKALEAVGIEE
jgi:ketosteroid isomerase-like protein